MATIHISSRKSARRKGESAVPGLWCAAAVLCVLGACASQTRIDIHAEHDPSARFSGFQTYAWAPTTEQVPGSREARALFDWRVRTAVTAELSAKGYIEQPGVTPDFLVDYRVVRKTKEINTFTDYFRYRESGGGSDISDAYVRGYQEGSLVLEILEPKTGRLLWYARASAVVNPKLQEDRVRRAVRAMLARFPPR